MSDNDLLECCQSILDFLCEDDDATWSRFVRYTNSTRNVSLEIPTPKQKIMDEVLNRNGWSHDMVGFTEYLNNLFQMGYEIQSQDGSFKPFFSSEQSRNFYRHFVRKLKLKQLV